MLLHGLFYLNTVKQSDLDETLSYGFFKATRSIGIQFPER